MEGGKESLSPIGDRLLDRIDAIGDEVREVAGNIQKLLQYVLIIGALNGTVTVGKLVDSVALRQEETVKTAEVEVHESRTGNPDTREAKPSQAEPTDRPL